VDHHVTALPTPWISGVSEWERMRRGVEGHVKGGGRKVGKVMGGVPGMRTGEKGIRQ